MDTREKLFIVGAPTIDKISIAERLAELDDSLKIASKFTSDNEYKGMTADNNNQHIYYNDNENINLDYKNNALLYIFSNEYISEGVTLDEFYNSDIIVMDIENFNVVSDKILNSVTAIIVWIDTKQHGDAHLIKETKFLMERLNKQKHIYFLNETESEMCKVILSYINGTPEERKAILKEFA